MANTKIKIVEDAEAAGEVAEAYDYWRASSGRKQVPGVLKSLSARPDFLKQAVDFSNTLQFSDGHLSRRHKEMIGCYASYLNRCAYCLDSHVFFSENARRSDQTVAAFREGDLDKANLNEAERALMKYVELVTRPHTAPLPKMFRHSATQVGGKSRSPRRSTPSRYLPCSTASPMLLASQYKTM